LAGQRHGLDRSSATLWSCFIQRFYTERNTFKPYYFVWKNTAVEVLIFFFFFRSD
jgi:hypothetical protein